MPIELAPYQRDAVDKLRVGSILCGGVGSGKSRTALAFYYEKICGASIDFLALPEMKTPKDLIIITTALKRDTFDWQNECAPFLLFSDPALSVGNVTVTVDSWNNIEKYINSDAFFIFDEQRVVGSGTWVKSFIKIAKRNPWILLTATPGDTWSDYIPVFIANGFYKNRTEFADMHIVWKRFVKWPQIEKYICTARLERLKAQILVPMAYEKKTVLHYETILVPHDEELQKVIYEQRWHPFEERPLRNASEMCQVLRKVTNTHPARTEALLPVIEKHKKVIVFYNFNYELDLLREFAKKHKIRFAEWNGHVHQLIPKGDSWLYLVQYTAGAEGWECIETDAIFFYSLNYSYKIMTQAGGRIDRRNTKFVDLYLYRVYSKSIIDRAINRILKNKKTFNEKKFVPDHIFASQT